jgi:chemotaxis response regulator CheB
LQSKRVLVIESGFFVGGVIDDILKNNCGDLELRAIVPANVAELKRAVADFKPDIIIADDTTPDEVLKAILLISLRFPALRVVVICADSNRVQIYNMERVEVAHLEDFLAVL